MYQRLRKPNTSQSYDSDDHMVPLPHGSEEIFLDLSQYLIKNERNEQITNEKVFKQKKLISPSELDGMEQDIYFRCDNNIILSVAGHNLDKWNKSLADMLKDSTSTERS